MSGGEANPSLLGRAFLLGAASTFFCLLLVFEGASRGLAASGSLYERVDVSGALTSLPELRDRIRFALSGPRPPVFVLGDSVLGATALLERGEPEARRKTVIHALRQDRAPSGERLESMAADGLVPGDLEVIVSLLEGAPEKRPGARAVVVLNVRMFAAEFGAEGKRVSRGFLLQALPPGARQELEPGNVNRDAALGARLLAGASENVYLFRTTQLLRTIWFDPTPRDSLQRVLESAVGRPQTGDLEEAALRLRVMRYYQDSWTASSPGVRSLSRLLNGLHRAGLRPIVVLSPQNPDFVEEAGPDVFASNRRLLREIATGAGVASYQDLGASFPVKLFLDHCHLTPPGNLRLAREIDSLLRENAE